MLKQNPEYGLTLKLSNVCFSWKCVRGRKIGASESYSEIRNCLWTWRKYLEMTHQNITCWRVTVVLKNPPQKLVPFPRFIAHAYWFNYLILPVAQPGRILNPLSLSLYLSLSLSLSLYLSLSILSFIFLYVYIYILLLLLSILLLLLLLFIFMCPLRVQTLRNV